MTRAVLFAIGLFFIGIACYAITNPTGDMSSFMNVTWQWNALRIFCGILFIAYSALDYVRQDLVRKFLGVVSVLVLLFTLFSFYSLYILAIDTFCLAVGGIYTLLGSLELSTNHPLHIKLPEIRFPKPDITFMLSYRTLSQMEKHYNRRRSTV